MKIDSDPLPALEVARATYSTLLSVGVVTLAEGYEAGRRLEDRRVADGWTRAGWKLGYTNLALWPTLGVTKPFFAPVYVQTVAPDKLLAGPLVQPRIEPEIVVGLASDLRPHSGSAEVADAIEWAAAGLEVVECHFEDWRMSVGEAVADAGLHAALAIGERVQMTSADATLLAEIECELICDGEVIDRGPATKALGGPVQALVWLLRDLPIGLRAGEFITTGSMTTAANISPGHRWANRLLGAQAPPPVELYVA